MFADELVLKRLKTTSNSNLIRKSDLCSRQNNYKLKIQLTIFWKAKKYCMIVSSVIQSNIDLWLCRCAEQWMLKIIGKGQGRSTGALTRATIAIGEARPFAVILLLAFFVRWPNCNLLRVFLSPFLIFFYSLSFRMALFRWFQHTFGQWCLRPC